MLDYEAAPRRRRSACSCCSCRGCCFAVLLLLLLCLVEALVSPYRSRDRDPARIQPPARNAFDDYAAAGALWEAGGAKLLPPPVAGVRTPLAAERQALAAATPALVRLRQGIGKVCVAPSGRSTDAAVSKLFRCASLGRLLACEADVRAAAGDHDGAFRSALDAMRVEADLTHGTDLWGDDVAGGIGTAVRPVATAQVARLGAADCERLGAQLRDVVASREKLSAVVAEDRSAAIAALTAARDLPINYREPGTRYSTESVLGIRRSSWARIGLRVAGARLIGDLGNVYGQAEREARKRPVDRVAIRWPRSVTSVVGAHYLERMLAPIQADDASRVHDDLLVCALAIRAYRLRHGVLPDSLAAIGLEPRWTTDPYSGRPFVYKPGSKSYALYSIGPDGVDDAGQLVLTERTIPAGRGDILYAVPSAPTGRASKAAGR